MDTFLVCIGELRIESSKKPLNPKDYIDGRPFVFSGDFKKKFLEPSIEITQPPRIDLEIYADIPLDQIYTEEVYFQYINTRRPHEPHQFWWIFVSLLKPFFTHQEKRILNEEAEKESAIFARDYDGMIHQVRLKFLKDIKCWDVRLYGCEYTTKGIAGAFVHRHTFD